MTVTREITALVKKALKKDQKAFSGLCEALATEVLYLCRRNLGNWYDAEDAAQEVFIILQKNISALNDPQSFEAWMNRIITNTCKAIGQKSMRNNGNIPIDDVNELLLGDTLDDLPVEYVETFELQERIVALVDSLPFKHRQCILLYYYQKLSVAQIAEIMECKPDDVKNNLRRARQIMKVELEDERKKNTTLWSASPLIAIGPALQAIFEKSAATTVPAGATQRVLEGIGVAKAAGAAGTLTGAAGIWQALSTVLKVVALFTVLVGGGYAIAYTTSEIINPTPTPPTPPVVAVSDPSDFLPQETIDDDTASWGDEDTPVQVAVNSLSGRVTLDNSSVIDPNARHGLAGITVDLINAEDDSIVSTETTYGGINHGIFQFEDVEPGRYKVKVILPDDAEIVSSTGYKTDTDGTVWLTKNGSSTITLDEDDPQALTDLNLVVRFFASLNGNVVLAAGDLQLESILPDVVVMLLDPQSRVVATTRLGSDGQYSFRNPLISQSGTYTVKYALERSEGLALDIDSLTVHLEPGQSKALGQHTLRDTDPPTISIRLTGGDCDCGHLNPNGAEITATDVTSVSVNWTIKDDGSGNVVASGSSNSELTNAIRSLAKGTYTITAAAQDAAGNQSQAEQTISITK